MGGIHAYFFPSGDHILLVSVCYLVSLMCGYRRYSQRADYGGMFCVPEDARPWTTWLRYYSSALIYLSMIFVVFATIHQLLLKYPYIVDWASENLPDARGLLERVRHDPDVAAPIITMVLLTIGVERINRGAEWDQRLRGFFQRRGSIPRRVENLIGELKHYDLERDVGELLQELPREVKDRISVPAAQIEKKTLERMYVRACQLVSAINDWKEWDSPFHSFTSLYRKQHGEAVQAFNRVKGKVLRYFKLSGELKPPAPRPGTPPEDVDQSQMAQKYPKLLQELRKEVREELKEVLENMYVLMACALNSEGKGGRSRKELLNRLGFKVDLKSPKPVRGLDINDLTVITLFLFFVIPLSAVVYYSFSGSEPLPAFKIFVIWSPMAMLIGLTSVVAALHVKKNIMVPSSPFWERIRTDVRGQWFPYALAGLISGGAGVLELMGLSYLDAEKRSLNPLELFNAVSPWFFVPFSLTFVTGIHLDRETAPSRFSWLREAATSALAAAAAGTVAFMILKNSFTWSTLAEAAGFVIPAAALLGGLVGGMVPAFYRRTKKLPASLQQNEVELKSILDACATDVAPLARSKSIRIDYHVDPEIPRLKKGDPELLKQAVSGLLSNALEFTQQGGGISFQAVLTEEGNIQIRVTDNGIGMEQAKVDEVKSQPAKPPDQDTAEAIGEAQSANLHQIKSILNLHGTDLDLDSKLFSGTSATTLFPRELTVDKAGGVPRLSHPA